MQRARQLAKDLPKQAGDVYVAHKAVMLINGRYHFVNINSTKLADVTDLEQGNQNEIHGTSDAEY